MTSCVTIRAMKKDGADKVFGYMDESGAPGVKSYKNDYFVLSLVVFGSEEVRDESIAKIDLLREKLRLPDDYEFHCSSNSTKPQMEFMKTLSSLNFRFITIAIRKNDFRKTASYVRISGLMMDEIEKHFPNIKIEMDSNPVLYSELRKRIRERKLKMVKIRERNSRHSRLIQVADYVANISAKKVKNTPKSRELYNIIADEVSIFIKITD